MRYVLNFKECRCKFMRVAGEYMREGHVDQRVDCLAGNRLAGQLRDVGVRVLCHPV